VAEISKNKKPELIVVSDDWPIKTKKKTPSKHEPTKSIDDVPISVPKTFEELLEEQLASDPSSQVLSAPQEKKSFLKKGRNKIL